MKSPNTEVKQDVFLAKVRLPYNQISGEENTDSLERGIGAIGRCLYR
jgi:hypothetical protein